MVRLLLFNLSAAAFLVSCGPRYAMFQSNSLVPGQTFESTYVAAIHAVTEAGFNIVSSEKSAGLISANTFISQVRIVASILVAEKDDSISVRLTVSATDEATVPVGIAETYGKQLTDRLCQRLKHYLPEANFVIESETQSDPPPKSKWSARTISSPEK